MGAYNALLKVISNAHVTHKFTPSSPFLYIALAVSLIAHGLLLFIPSSPSTHHASYVNKQSALSISIQKSETSSESRNDEVRVPAQDESEPAAISKIPGQQNVAYGIEEKFYAVNELNELPYPKQPLILGISEWETEENREAKLRLELFLDENGEILSVKVMSTQGTTDLKEAVIKAIEHRAFVPGKIDGVPVKSRFTLVLGLNPEPLE